MQGFKPNARIWQKINAAILDENLATVLITMQSGMCAMLVAGGVCTDEEHARVHLAAMLLSPDTSPTPGSLAKRLGAEFTRFIDGKWLT